MYFIKLNHVCNNSCWLANLLKGFHFFSILWTIIKKIMWNILSWFILAYFLTAIWSIKYQSSAFSPWRHAMRERNISNCCDTLGVLARFCSGVKHKVYVKKKERWGMSMKSNITKNMLRRRRDEVSFWNSPSIQASEKESIPRAKGLINILISFRWN